MRRRQAFQQQVEVGKNVVANAHLANMKMAKVDLTTENTLPPKTLGRGYCRHCSKYIGKGIYFHEKHCNVRTI